MAKKKPATAKKSAVCLTDDQLAKLAGIIYGTRANVYSMARSVIGDPTADLDQEDLFTRLESQHDLFRCNECNEWKIKDQISAFMYDTCHDCEPEEAEA
jgi:hypothetical protein